MKNFTKTVLIGGTLSLSLLLGACSNSGSDIATIDGVTISTENVIGSVESSIGEENMKRIFLYEYLHSKYKASEKEIEERLKEFDATYGGDGAGISYLKEYYGYSDERIKTIFKEEILVEKALKEYKKIEDKDVEEVFNKEGNNISRDVLEVHISATEKEQVEKFTKLLKEGKSVEEIKDLIGENKSIEVSQNEYTNFDLSDVNYELSGSKKGEVLEVDNSEAYGVISLYLVLDTKEIKLEDVKEQIEKNLVYTDSNYEAWLYNEIIKNKNVQILDNKFDYIKIPFVTEVAPVKGEDVEVKEDVEDVEIIEHVEESTKENDSKK